MFSIEFGLTREQNVRALIDDESEGDDVAPRTFKDSCPNKSSAKLLIITTDALSEAFVSTYLSSDPNPSECGYVESVEDVGRVARYVEVSQDALCCQVNEAKINLNDVNNLAMEISNGLSGNTKLLILHTMQPTFDGRDETTSARYLKSSKWTAPVSRPLTLMERPTVVGGIAAAVLSLAELKKMEALLVCSNSSSSSIDSVSLSGFSQAWAKLGLADINLVEANETKTRLRSLQKRMAPSLLYI